MITAILTYGGVSLFVVIFVLISLTKPLFKQLNIAWNLVVIPIQIGLGTFTWNFSRRSIENTYHW